MTWIVQVVPLPSHVNSQAASGSSFSSADTMCFTSFLLFLSQEDYFFWALTLFQYPNTKRDNSVTHDEWMWDNSYCFPNKGMWNTMDLSYRIKNGLHGSVSSVAACCHRSPFVLWTIWGWLLCCSEVPVTQCWQVRLKHWMKQTSVTDPGFEDLEKMQEQQ